MLADTPRAGTGRERAAAMTATRHLTFVLAVLMCAQSAGGLLAPGRYRDVDWIRAACRDRAALHTGAATTGSRTVTAVPPVAGHSMAIVP